MSDLLREVKKEKIFQEIVRQIRHLISSGNVRAGDKLPPERDLAQVFKVSRASVREAIRYLESSGLVRSRVGDGTYVAADSVESLVEPLAAVISGERESLVELFAIRKMIEPQLAFLAAREVSLEQLAELDRILTAQRQAEGSSERFTAVDYSFHLRIAVAAGSRVYLKLYTALADMLNQTREEFLQEGDRPLRSLAGHEAILAALRDHDPARARAAMAAHLRTIEGEALKARGTATPARGS